MTGELAITSQDLGLNREQTLELVAALEKLNESTQGAKQTDREARLRTYLCEVIKGLRGSLEAA
jgi:hypothetical protein